MFLRMMIINDLHIRVICMLIVWIYWGEAFVSYCLIDFFPRFVYPVGSFVVLRTEGKLCSIKIRLLARTILLLCALSYAGLDMIMPCL